MELQKELLQILACPRCHASLAPVEENGTLVGLRCDACALVFPVRDSIPVMLLDEAIALADWNQGKR